MFYFVWLFVARFYCGSQDYLRQLSDSAGDRFDAVWLGVSEQSAECRVQPLNGASTLEASLRLCLTVDISRHCCLVDVDSLADNVHTWQQNTSRDEFTLLPALVWCIYFCLLAFVHSQDMMVEEPLQHRSFSVRQGLFVLAVFMSDACSLDQLGRLVSSKLNLTSPCNSASVPGRNDGSVLVCPRQFVM